MAFGHRCHRTWELLRSHLLLMLVTMMFTTSSVDAQRSYRRQVGLLRSTNHLPTDPWQLFNISITQTGNKTEGMQILTLQCKRRSSLCRNVPVYRRIYTVDRKNGAAFIFTITFENMDRFNKSFTVAL